MGHVLVSTQMSELFLLLSILLEIFASRLLLVSAVSPEPSSGNGSVILPINLDYPPNPWDFVSDDLFFRIRAKPEPEISREDFFEASLACLGFLIDDMRDKSLTPDGPISTDLVTGGSHRGAELRLVPIGGPSTPTDVPWTSTNVNHILGIMSDKVREYGPRGVPPLTVSVWRAASDPRATRPPIWVHWRLKTANNPVIHGNISTN